MFEMVKPANDTVVELAAEFMAAHLADRINPTLEEAKSSVESLFKRCLSDNVPYAFVMAASIEGADQAFNISR